MLALPSAFHKSVTTFRVNEEFFTERPEEKAKALPT